MRSKRLGRLGLSDDPVILAMLEYVAARPGMQRHLQAKTYGDSIINTRETLHAALAGQLHRSVDGRGLTPSAVVPDQHGFRTHRTPPRVDLSLKQYCCGAACCTRPCEPLGGIPMPPLPAMPAGDRSHLDTSSRCAPGLTPRG